MSINKAPYHSTQFGHFLKPHFWHDALKLLQFQLDLKQDGHKHFNTIGMFYYEKLAEQATGLSDSEYFDKKVGSSLFYGLRKEFRVYPHNIPKQNGIGLRNYKLLTYPLRTLHYAVGLYLLALSQEFLQQYYSPIETIDGYYGGRLVLDEEDRLRELKRNHVYFLSHYQTFGQQAESEIKGDLTSKVIIRFDIQNYFDEISVQVLMELLRKQVKSNIQKKLDFDEPTRKQINSFYRYISGGKSGIPQMDNNVVSSFIGYLYLVFGDLLIDDVLRERDYITAHRIIRYMDDIILSITFQEGVTDVERDRYAELVAQEVSELLYDELDVRINMKSKLYRLDDPDEKEDYIDSLKNVSPGYQVSKRQMDAAGIDGEEDSDEEASSDDEEPYPISQAEAIFEVLERLKISHIDQNFQRFTQKDSDILKSIYNEEVRQILDREDFHARIADIFDADFSFDLIQIEPIPLLIIIMKHEDVSRRLKEFLLEKKNLSTRDSAIILNYLLQIDLADDHLLEKLKSDSQLGEVIEQYQEAEIHSDFPGYFELSNDQICQLADKYYIVTQIQSRRNNERSGEYSVALNHLLNELHAICFWLDEQNDNEMKHYNAISVGKFLEIQGIPHQIAIQMRNLFDRRNSTPVSHPGSDDSISWSVTEEEYWDYYNSVGQCLKLLL